MHYARLAAGTALIGGRKNVEMVQAYLILAMNPVPCRRWEDDRSWVFLGLAIRCVVFGHFLVSIYAWLIIISGFSSFLQNLAATVRVS